MSFEIRDESGPDGDRFQLYVNGQRRCHVTRKKNGLVNLHWDIAGAMYWPEAKEVVEGLLELTIIADQLIEEPTNGKSRRKIKV